ncbi:MADS-box protein GGM13-like [Salvia hispanica]|uniref:MADS-box protein GGM13-like n=1 Tax=Salvia hispanica TaxID=49212 RepID=UPI0020097815|nr:MADS-box protein GGM13-like [Salvia hispanica]
MGRKKLTMRRIENPTSRQLTYTKRKEGIIKKAGELAVLCDTDVALIMFSPSGRLASNKRIEDILLRFVDRPDELRGGPINHEEAKLLGNQLSHERTENVEMQAAMMQMDDALTSHSAEGNHARVRSNMDENQSRSSSAEPHLSLGFIESQKMWNKSWNIY